MIFNKLDLAKLVRFYSLIFDRVIVENKAKNQTIVVKDNGIINDAAFNCEWFSDNANVVIEENKISKRIDTFDNQFSIVVSFVVDDGEVNWELTFVARINDLQAAQSIIGSSLTNILDMYNEKLYLDSLTNTYNRRYYDEKLKGLETANGAAMLDIDDFKSINDTYGHTVGDIVLTKVASAIKGLIRNSDAVVRYGGDEFFILFWNIPKDVLLTKLEIIKKRIEEIAIEGHPDLKVSASIGAVHHVDATEALLIEADKNLYIAKKDKNNVIM